ncbi:hypothetical protein DPEC_G00208730 [Dallia pectoralis]|uniref:Uncharacterized protein n=1 Tax=Dallia pectoralis TaxID=75939 RepID=A0ACC2G4Z4_DALPE|nr:hypothetical protein DPEC_G00208730 [Dallia pectoralis]
MSAASLRNTLSELLYGRQHLGMLEIVRTWPQNGVSPGAGQSTGDAIFRAANNHCSSELGHQCYVRGETHLRLGSFREFNRLVNSNGIELGISLHAHMPSN